MGFEENLATFNRFCPKYTSQIQTRINPSYQLCLSDNGSVNLKILNESKETYIHSKINPEEEAESWFYSIIEIDSLNALVVFGIGLGYYYDAAIEWLRKDSNRFLIFIEQDFAILRLFFETERATKMMKDPQVIVCAINKEIFEQEKIEFGDLELIGKILINGNSLLTELKSYGILYNNLWRMLKRAINYYLKELDWGRRFFTPTSIDQMQRNSVKNLFSLRKFRLIYPLQNTFKGIPAIICGAGPSLDEEIEKLKTLKEHALVFGAGTGMNVLNQLQCFAHFGIGIDPEEASMSRILTNFAYDTPYCYTLKFYHEALEILHGPKLYFKGDDLLGINSWFENKLGLREYERIHYTIGSTYAALAVAKFFGCNPIIFLGVDLAYTGKRRYPESIKSHPTDSEETKININVLSSYETIKMKNSEGEEILTRADWIREAFEYQTFAKNNPSLKLINATSKGLNIQGFEKMSFDEVISQYLQEPHSTSMSVKQALERSCIIEHSSTQIKNLISEWIECLEEGEKLLQEIDALLPGEESTSLWEKLTEKPVYSHFLRNIHLNYDNFFFIETFPLQYRKEQFTDEEYLTKKKECEKTKVGFLLSYLGIIKRIYLEDLQQDDDDVISGKSEIPYKNGTLDGVVKLYYSNGKLKREISFEDGKLNGKERYWDKNGQLLLDVNYSEGKPFGIARSWYSNGQMKLEKKYHASGRYDLKRWNEKGELIENKSVIGV